MKVFVSWVNRHDSLKLFLITLVMIPYMRLVMTASGDLDPFCFAVFGGVTLCGVASYWLGNWKWILIPFLAILVEIAWAIPASLSDPNAMETPLSIVLEAPFWTGMPTLIGSGVGYLIKRANS